MKNTLLNQISESSITSNVELWGCTATFNNISVVVSCIGRGAGSTKRNHGQITDKHFKTLNREHLNGWSMWNRSSLTFRST